MTQDAAIASMPLQDAARLQAQLGAPLPVLLPTRDNRSMTVRPAARTLLESLVGQPISTVTGRPNTVLRVEGDSAVVATNRSPTGQPVPIEWVQSGLERVQARPKLAFPRLAIAARLSVPCCSRCRTPSLSGRPLRVSG